MRHWWLADEVALAKDSRVLDSTFVLLDYPRLKRAAFHLLHLFEMLLILNPSMLLLEPKTGSLFDR